MLVEEVEIGAVQLAHCLIGRIRQRHVRIVVESDKRIEAAVDVDGAGTVAEHACVAEVVVDNRSVVDPITATHDRLVVNRVGEPEAWSNISSVRFDESEELRLETTLSDCSDDGAGPSACRWVRRVRIKATQEAARLFTRAAVVVADADIHGQFGSNLDVVLGEESI